jgi:hypothetical protein
MAPESPQISEGPVSPSFLSISESQEERLNTPLWPVLGIFVKNIFAFKVVVEMGCFIIKIIISTHKTSFKTFCGNVKIEKICLDFTS